VRVHDLDQGERRLGARAVTTAGRRGGQRVVPPLAAAPLRRRTEERPGARREVLLQARDLQLELGLRRALRLRQRAGQLYQPPMERTCSPYPPTAR